MGAVIRGVKVLQAEWSCANLQQITSHEEKATACDWTEGFVKTLGPWSHRPDRGDKGQVKDLRGRAADPTPQHIK